jgi:hypothetical protein
MVGFSTFAGAPFASTGDSSSVVAVQVSEILALTGASTAELLLTIRELLTVATSTPVLANRSDQIQEALDLRSRIIPVLDALVNDSVALTQVLTGVPSATVALVESLRLTGEAQTNLVAMAQIVEALVTRSLLVSLQDATITDAAALTEALEARMLAMQTLISSAAFADELTGLAQVTVVLQDGVEFDETLTPTGMFLATIVEGLDFSLSFVFDGVPYSGYSLNAATKAVTTYTNYPFNSMAVFNGEVHGASDEGLYKLGGATDAGDQIVWKLRTGMSNYGTGRNKGLDAAYLGYTATGRIALKCIIVAPTGEKIVYWYELTPRPAATPTPGRITMGRGLRSVYWGFELTNVDAGDIELDVLELHPIVLDGRLP